MCSRPAKAHILDTIIRKEQTNHVEDSEGNPITLDTPRRRCASLVAGSSTKGWWSEICHPSSQQKWPRGMLEWSIGYRRPQCAVRKAEKSDEEGSPRGGDLSNVFWVQRTAPLTYGGRHRTGCDDQSCVWPPVKECLPLMCCAGAVSAHARYGSVQAVKHGIEQKTRARRWVSRRIRRKEKQEDADGPWAARRGKSGTHGPGGGQAKMPTAAVTNSTRAPVSAFLNGHL